MTMKNFKSITRQQVSNDLLWEITNNNTCLLVKSQGLTLSRDPMNLTNLNTKRDSGIANNHAMGINFSTVNKRVKNKKVKKTAPVIRLNLALRTTPRLTKNRLTGLKTETPVSNNCVYSNTTRLTARSVVKVINPI